jgi:hypothetical protein
MCQWYMEVHGSTRICKIVCTGTGMYWSFQGMLFCWIFCCNSALQKALHWRPVYLITLMQAQALFNQQLPVLQQVLIPTLPFLEGGVSGGSFVGGRSCFHHRALQQLRGSSLPAGAVSAGELMMLVLALREGTGTDAVLVTYLQVKVLAAGLPPGRISWCTCRSY